MSTVIISLTKHLSIKLLPLVLVISLMQCEKYTGYDYSAESIGVRSNIFGTVSNKYNYEPVMEADIVIGTMHTRTDENGDYSIVYLIGTDEQRDKQINMQVTAENYFALDTSLVVIPPTMEFNLSMTYAAPIIERAWWGTTPYFVIIDGQVAAQPVTQVLIYDYQGVSNIDTVYSVFYYAKMGSPEIRTDTIGMKFISQLSANQAYYQAIGVAHVGEGFVYYERKVNIFVIDQDKFSDTISERDVNDFADQPLFPIVYN